MCEYGYSLKVSFYSVLVLTAGTRTPLGPKFLLHCVGCKTEQSIICPRLWGVHSMREGLCRRLAGPCVGEGAWRPAMPRNRLFSNGQLLIIPGVINQPADKWSWTSGSLSLAADKLFKCLLAGSDTTSWAPQDSSEDLELNIYSLFN